MGNRGPEREEPSNLFRNTEHEEWRTQASGSQAREHLSSQGSLWQVQGWAGSGPSHSLPDDISVLFSLPQFLLIFRKAAAGELQEDSGLHVLARLSEIDVSTEGVKGAKSFFEAKVRNGGL